MRTGALAVIGPRFTLALARFAKTGEGRQAELAQTTASGMVPLAL